MTDEGKKSLRWDAYQEGRKTGWGGGWGGGGGGCKYKKWLLLAFSFSQLLALFLASSRARARTLPYVVPKTAAWVKSLSFPGGVELVGRYWQPCFARSPLWTVNKCGIEIRNLSAFQALHVRIEGSLFQRVLSYLNYSGNLQNSACRSYIERISSNTRGVGIIVKVLWGFK